MITWPPSHASPGGERFNLKPVVSICYCHSYHHHHHHYKRCYLIVIIDVVVVVAVVTLLLT